MARQGIVFVNDEEVGNISYQDGQYIFKYRDDYFNNAQKKAISVTLPKTEDTETGSVAIIIQNRAVIAGIVKL